VGHLDIQSQRVGGFSEQDGTIDFYSRISCLIDENSIVLDLGAGRASWNEDKCFYRRNLRLLKGKVAEVIACDVDEAVLLNNTADKVLLMKNNHIPVLNESIDLVIADFVLEHVKETSEFACEINRVLKPGGWFTARTPHKNNVVAIFARIIKNKFHKQFLKYIQPDRKEIDIFPTYYKVNTLRKISKLFPSYLNKSFIYRGEPSYYFGSKIIFSLLKFFYRFLSDILVGNLFIFIKKNV
tara:strand:+ start:244 stop:963 length:720 start_codon:yes stop_codon:yes gene_type:complete